MKSFDLCVIGGGAAGMAAAVSAALTNPDLQICLLERNDKLGKKLYATGNGRCNLSHANSQDQEEVLQFFHRVGIVLRTEDDGRMYPASGTAADVVGALERMLQRNRTTIYTSCRINALHRDNRLFLCGPVCADRVILATGGKAGPQFGCEGDGFLMARALGHTIRRIYPALTALQIRHISALQGVRVPATVRLLRKGRCLAEERGEVQFNQDGCSGICVMNLSREVCLEETLRFQDYQLQMSFYPGDACALLFDRKNREGWTAADLLLTVVPPALSSYLLQRAGMDPDQIAVSLSSAPINRLAGLLNACSFTLTGARGWRYAQCTAGGVPWQEVDPKTMASCVAPGLYLAGEIMDYDGPCGGYNLHHAWRTGIRAGRSAARV